MAGDWIKMRSNLRTHPKVVRMASALQADRLKTVGGLHAVWCLFDEHSIDGRLHGYTPEAVDDLVGWPGFSSALIAIKWMEWDGSDGLTLPEFDTHNGASAKRRAMDADRKRAERDAEKERPQSVRNLSASNPDKSVTREEKRREELDTSSASAEKTSRKKPRTTYPEDFAPNETGKAICLKAGFSIEEESAAFKNHHQAQGSLMADWQAGFRTWIDKAKKFRKPQPVWQQPTTRVYDSAEDTKRMLAEQSKGTTAMPAAIRQFAEQIKVRTA